MSQIFGAAFGCFLSTLVQHRDNNKLYAVRLAHHLLSIESNFGYYTSSTYFGEQGDILTMGFSFQNQIGGTGSVTESGDFYSYTFDILSEIAMSDVEL